MGDDIVDLAVLDARRVCRRRRPTPSPRCARASTGSAASSGGDGAARELIELILRAQELWDAIVAGYADEGARPRRQS